MNKQPHENFNFKKEFKKFITSISGILSSTKNVNVPTKKIEEIQELLKTLERHYEYIKNDEQISIEEKRNTEQLINKYKQDLEELKQSKKHKFNFLSSQQTKSTSNTENEKTTHNKPTTQTTKRLFAVLSDYLNEKVTITETTKNSFDDLTKIYDYLQIFKSFESNHTYKIERYERKNNIIFNYTNYVSGIIDMNKLNRTHFPKTKTGHKDMQDTNEYKRTLQRILSLDNIKKTILNNYGNIGVLKNKSFFYCSF